MILWDRISVRAQLLASAFLGVDWGSLVASICWLFWSGLSSDGFSHTLGALAGWTAWLGSMGAPTMSSTWSFQEPPQCPPSLWSFQQGSSDLLPGGAGLQETNTGLSKANLGAEVGLPGLANKTRAHPIQFEFQINDNNS